jgi:protein-S-isoprenylcysteine O-methyltransferase Ste14
MIRRFTQIGIVLALLALILLLGSGNLGWVWAWVIIGIYTVGIALTGVAMRKHTDTIVERGKATGMRDWDKIVSGLWGVLFYIVIPLVAALDERFDWSKALLWVNLLGCALFILGYFLFVWAMVTNAYFSSVVRIQTERGHQVCCDGPYKFVRHPGYVGAILQTIGLALALSSYWAVIPALAAIAAMTIRTAFEDRMLQKELPGYTEYASKVKQRLIPGVW